MVRRSLEMSLSREEFFRLLPAAVGPFEASVDSVRGNAGACRWSITLVRLADHRAGSVAMPRHRIDVLIEGCSETDAEAFMERFRRGFLRGGG
jgi:hypothetical protein